MAKTRTANLMPEQQPTVTAPDYDAEYLQAAAELEAMQAFTREKCLQREVAAEQQTQRTQRLERWAKLGPEFDAQPLPDSIADAPMHVQMKVAAVDPELARELGVTTPLPAGAELRLSKGIDFLQPEDVPALEAAGHHETIAKLRQRHQEQMMATFEANHAAAMDPELKAQEQAEMEARRLASEAQSNAAARGQWLAATNAGAPNPLVADAIRLGRL
jgi:hypothetical protein